MTKIHFVDDDKVTTRRVSDAPRQTWAAVVLASLRATGQPVKLSDLNRSIEVSAPELVAKNPHWSAKVRQVLQRLRDAGLAENVSKGVWRATPVQPEDADGQTA